MKRKFKIFGCVVASSILLLSAPVFADTASESIADIVARITGKTTQEVVDMRTEGMTYGEIANSFGKLEEFKSETGRDYCTGSGNCNNPEGYHHNKGHRQGRRNGGHHGRGNGNCMNNETCPYNK